MSTVMKNKNLFLKILKKKIYVHMNTHIGMFIESLLVMVKKWKQSQLVSV